MLSATPRRLLLLLVLLAPAVNYSFLLPKRGGQAAAGASTQDGGWGGGLGRLLAEAVEGVGGGKREGAAPAHPSVQRADELLRKVSSRC